jgi:uncharacterized protein (TIGR01777 family)
MRILVSGASGFVGTHMRQYLADAGHEVFQLVRREPDMSGRQIPWDPAAGKVDTARLGGFDALINLCGENIAGRWNDAMKARIRNSRVKTTRLLAEAMASLERARPPVFVCASAIGYYGNRGNTILTEDSPPGRGFLADVCKQWEGAADPARAAGVRVVNLRIGVVLSPAGGALARMLPIFRVGMGAVVGSGHQWISWITLSDLLRVFEFVTANRSLSGPVNAVSPNPVTNRQFTKAVGRILNRPTLLPMPAAAVRLALGEMGVETLLASARIVPSRLEAVGFQFHHPDIEEALRYELEHTPGRVEIAAGV